MRHDPKPTFSSFSNREQSVLIDKPVLEANLEFRTSKSDSVISPSFEEAG